MFKIIGIILRFIFWGELPPPIVECRHEWSRWYSTDGNCRGHSLQERVCIICNKKETHIV